MSPLLAIVSCKVLFFCNCFFRITFLFNQLLSKHSFSRNPLGVVDFPRLRPSWPEICLDRKSPIISPDIENGRGSLDFPLTVRDAPDEIPLTAQASKPNLNPESRDSPRITARQQMTSGEGGLSDSTSRRKSGSLGPS